MTMNLKHLVKSAEFALRKKSPTILASIGVVGTVTTAVLAARGSFAAAKDLEKVPEDATIQDKVKVVWTHYIPATVSGVATIGCIAGGTKIGNKRTAAAVAAYSITESAFSQYKDQVVKEFGVRKDEKIRDAVAQETVITNPPPASVVMGDGTVLCCELYTRRYFMCDMETLRKAQNDINAMLVSDLYVSLNEFYYRVKLPYTSASENLGWDSQKLLELKFTTTLSEDGRPCLAFEYNYVKPI